MEAYSKGRIIRGGKLKNFSSRSLGANLFLDFCMEAYWKGIIIPGGKLKNFPVVGHNNNNNSNKQFI